MRRSLPSSLSVFLLLTALAAGPALAQGTSAVLKGRLVSTAGDGIPGVALQISSKAQPSGNVSAITDIEGNYRAAPLPPAGDYMIKVDYPGFAVIEVGPIDLDPGRTTVQDVTLRTDTEMVDVIQVTADDHAVDLDNPAVNTILTGEFLEALPLIGHTWQAALVLAPGV